MEAKFQYYDGNIKHPIPRGFITLEQFIDRHENPSSHIIKVLAKIEDARKVGDDKLKADLKQNNLYYFTPAIIIKDGCNRRYDNIESFTGLMQIDIDKINNAEELRGYLFNYFDCVVCCYLSPSRNGVKALVRIPIVETVDEFKEYFIGFKNSVEEAGIDGFDNSPQNPALPLFISADSFLLYRNNPTIWEKKGVKKVEFHKQYPLPPSPTLYTKANEKNKRRALATIRKVISGITDNGHPQLRGACLILGTRIGAGYLDFDTAWNEVEYNVRNSSYLAKGVKGYLTTAQWAIDEGYKTPKYY